MSSLSPPTWVSFRRRPVFFRPCAICATRHGALLIFDEVITGFRVCYGGAQTLFGITPDLTTLGKIIGGGLPVAAYGGRRDLMDRVAPLGPVYQAGTLSGNPLAMSAGIATLDLLAAPGFYESLDERAKHLGDGIVAALQGYIALLPPQSAPARSLRYSSRASPLPITPPRRNATRAASPHFSAPCSIAVFFWRRRSLKRCSFPRPTRTQTSIAQLQHAARAWQPLPDKLIAHPRHTRVSSRALLDWVAPASRLRFLCFQSAVESPPERRRCEAIQNLAYA